MRSLDMQFGSERGEARPSAESFAGVSLVQLAAIAAARAQGFSLEEILNAEGLAQNVYRAADVAYKRRLADSGERERLAADYQKELVRAEDRLTRKVSPIDEDVDAWVRFLGAYGEQSAPTAWLEALGLTLPDLSRLSRAWKQRLDADEALRRRAEKAAKDKKPHDSSSLRVSSAKLIPSPFAKSAEKPTLQHTAPFPLNPFLPRTEPPPELAEPIGPQNLGQIVDFPVKSAPLAHLAITAPVFSVPTEEDILPFVPGPDFPDEPHTAEERAAALAPPRESLSGTSLAVEVPRGAATPFVGAHDEVSVPEKPKPAAVELAGTSLVVDVPRGPAIPFVKSDKPVEIEVESAKEKSPPAVELGGTSLAVDIPRGPATPFEKLDKPVAVAGESADKESPQVKPTVPEAGGTSLAVDIPRGPATPFVKSDKPVVIPAEPKLPQVKPVPEELGGTSLAVEIPRELVMPFSSAKKEETPRPKPQLSLEQHAALMVEIATYPARTLAILKQYGLTPPQKVDLDQHYQRVVASDPAKQAAWHAAYNAHYVALMRRR